jgi:exodeoxyribonuclease VII large subunit
MTSLFDLPFEPEQEPEPEPSRVLSPPASRDVPPAAAGGDILTVSQLTADVRTLLESQFLRVAVEGELSNCRAWNGLLYFTLKDAGAQLRVVMFRSAVRLLRFKPEDGQHVVARGRLSVYDPKGEYQLIGDRLEPHGLGALQLAYEQLKRRLDAEGLFKAERKRALPVLPRTVGVVTSLEGAALHDILTVLRARYPQARVVIRPARVQGDGAPQDIARALAAIARVPGMDVVIVGRGGGSIEDLWAFNEEVVARAIVRCPVPVIAAVGHETDVTIADFAADLRAPTPSAAAALVASRHEEVCGRLDRTRDRLRGALEGRVLRLRSAVQTISGAPAFAGWPARLAMRSRHLAESAHALQRAVHARLDRSFRTLDTLHARLEARDLRRRAGAARGQIIGSVGRLQAGMVRQQHRHAARLGALAGRLDTLSPLAVLGRGYAVCWNMAHDSIVRDAAELHAGDSVRVVLARGAIEAGVTRTVPPEDGDS